MADNTPGPDTPMILWLNGRFVPVREAVVSPFDRGFLYGDGLFETLRAEGDTVFFLAEHLERLARSLDALRIRADLSLDWERLLRELLERNGLHRGVASVKILVTRGEAPGLGLPEPTRATLCVTAQRATLPSPALYGSGWRLHVFRSGYAPPLAPHKSLNYLYFLTARQAALDSGAHEAVLLDPWGRVTEASVGSLLLRTQNRWWTPESPCQLPGITLAQVAEKLLQEEGLSVERRSAAPSDLEAAETVWVLNSLMGVMPVSHIDTHPVPNPDAEAAARMRSRLFGHDPMQV